MILFAAVSSIVFMGMSYAQTSEHIHMPHPHRHAQYAKVRNPIPMTEESVMKGKELYEKHCIACHGEGGKGSGTMNLVDEVWIHGDSDGEIYHVIMDGVKGTPMRAFKKALTKDMRWHLVNYIKGLKEREERKEDHKSGVHQKTE